jgi:hypothetical protein
MDGLLRQAIWVYLPELQIRVPANSRLAGNVMREVRNARHAGPVEEAASGQ